MRYDAVVIGLGVIGSACAAELAGRGWRVLGVDRFPRGQSLGSSRGGSRLLREFHPSRPDLGRMARTSRTTWQRLAAQTGRELFFRTGGLVVSTADDYWTARLAEAARSNIPHELREDLALRELTAHIRYPPDAVGLYEPGAGVLFAERCVETLQDTATDRGATLRFGVRALLADDSLDHDDPVTVLLDDECVVATRVVYAVGPWTPALPFADRMPPLSVERAVVHWIAAPNSANPSAMPFVILVDDEFSVLPRLPGQGIKYGRFGTGESTAADTVDRTVRAEELARDTALLRKHAPTLAANKPTRSQVCLCTHTPDGSFLLGYPLPRVLVISACSGSGFKFAPALAETVAELLFNDNRTPAFPSIRIESWY
jgi:sarcosine oxidase